MARRLGRIFAHAYFHHREAFEQAEAESSLYARFLTLTSKFDLVPSEFLVIPPRLGHLEDPEHSGEVEPPRLLAAAVDPQRERARDSGRLESRDEPGDNLVLSIGRDMLHEGERRGSPLSSGDGSRKLGRSRTDTMVFSEAVSIAEDLARMEELEQTSVALPPTETEVPSIDSAVEQVEPAPAEPAAVEPSSAPEPEDEQEVQEVVPEPELDSEEEPTEPEEPVSPEAEDQEESSEPPAPEEIAEPESKPMLQHVEADGNPPTPESDEEDESFEKVEAEESSGSESDEDDTPDEVPEPKQNVEEADVPLKPEDEVDVSFSVGDVSMAERDEVEDLIDEQSVIEDDSSIVVELKSEPPDSEVKAPTLDQIPASDVAVEKSSSEGEHKEADAESEEKAGS